jgi:ubiquinone/menaquinone biosynthesis C-methylase UbiE
MSTVQADFDRIALVSADGWTQNNHYHNFLLRQIPTQCEQSLEIGCGTGAFARVLAHRSQRVLALDFSPEMIRVARARSESFANIEFQVADVMSRALPAEQFDCIASIATLHHLPLREILLRMKAALKPGGVLLAIDLFEPERKLLKSAGFPINTQALIDNVLNVVAMFVSVGLRLIHTGHLRPPREVRAAWAEHECHDIFPSLKNIRELCAEILPGAKVRRHLMWRYSIVWKK